MVILELFVVLMLVLLNGALAMSEFAVISARSVRLRQMARNGVRGAWMALRLIRDPGRFLSTVQIGITLVGILAGAFSGATLGAKLGEWLNTLPAIAPRGDMLGIGLMVIAVTYLSLVIGELVPKRIALVNPERIAAAIARPMYVLSRIAAPAVWLLKQSMDAVLRPFGMLSTRATGVSEEEVRSLLAEAAQAGIFVPQERAMIEAVLRLTDRGVSSVMTPRQEVLWLDRRADRKALLEASGSNPSARLLVCDGSIDEPLGVVSAKDLLPVALRGEDISLEALLTPVVTVTEDGSILQLLERFKREKIHVAVVTAASEGEAWGDGETLGLVTLTDILDSIASELPEPAEPSEMYIIRRQDGSWLIDGRLPIDEFERLLRVDDLRRTPNVETVAGFILSHLGRIPREGERFVVGDTRIEIVDMDGNRVDKVIVSAEPGAPELAFP